MSTNTEQRLQQQIDELMLRLTAEREESNSLIGQLEIEVESLQRQVAMLNAYLKTLSCLTQRTNLLWWQIIAREAYCSTQATAEAYEKELAAKVLEEAKSICMKEKIIGEDASYNDAINNCCGSITLAIAELRAANKKENE